MPLFSWLRRSSAPGSESDTVSQVHRLVARAAKECTLAEICKDQSECLVRSFRAADGCLESWRSRITSNGATEELIAVMERGIDLVKSCKKRGWVIRTLLRGESRHEFVEIHNDLLQSLELLKVSFRLGEVEGLRMPQPGEFDQAADRDRTHLCELSCELQIMLQTMLQGFANIHNYQENIQLVLEKLLIQHESMKVVKHLGHGAYGTVYEAIWNKNVVAVKVLRGIIPSSELRIASFKHPNIVSVIGYSYQEDNEEHCIVMERMDNDLKAVMKKWRKKNANIPKRKPPFQLKLCISMMLQIAKGMRYLHANNIVHRDLKPENIFVADLEAKSDWVVKIGDFGTSRWDFDTFRGDASPNQGTPGFRAPEVYRSQTYSRSADVFSYGMTCYNILTGEVPLEEVELARDRDSELRQGRRPRLGGEWHPDLKILLQNCWNQEPSRRPDFGNVYQSLYSLKLHY